MTTGTEGQGSGADFRAKFEALQAERDTFAQVSRNLAASAFKFVEPGDFDGVEPAKYVEHAQAVSERRAQEREALFAEMAKERGLDLSASGGSAPAPKQESIASRISSIGELSGRPPAGPEPDEGLTGRAALEAIYAARERARG
jgi:hypothetical protein